MPSLSRVSNNVPFILGFYLTVLGQWPIYPVDWVALKHVPMSHGYSHLHYPYTTTDVISIADIVVGILRAFSFQLGLPTHPLTERGS